MIPAVLRASHLSELVPTYRVGKRDRATTRAFLNDLASRLNGRVQISSDALHAYAEGVDAAFGSNVDYGQIVKTYEAEPLGLRRYSPPKIVAADRYVVWGRPRHDDISTSYIERQNLTMRMQMRRFTRLTNAFSKKADSLRAAVALHSAHYNFVGYHRTLRATPAMRAGVTTRLWSLGDLLNATL